MSDDRRGRVKRRRQLAVRFENFDMRTRRARRLKAILAGLIVDFGEDNPHSLRELALYRLALEGVQADLVAGKPGAREHAVRMSNCIARIERELRAGGRQKSDPAPSLHDYLASKYGEAAA